MTLLQISVGIQSI
jgi:hypothetical protein